MKKLFYFVLLGIFSLSAFAKNESKNNHILDGYFRYFNYNNTSTQDTSFQIEARLLNISNQILKVIYTTENKKDKHQMSMILVYTAMYLLNNNNGAKEGKISFNTLITNGSLSNTNSLKAEVLARYQLADKLLSISLKEAPEDERIESWYLANLLRWQQYEFGIVDESILDRIIEISVKAPMFHLFNGLTMSSDYPFGEEREQKLFELVELMTGPDSPCKPFIKFLRKGDAKKCNTTKMTPYAYQGTSVYLGDAYVRQALKIQNTDHDKADKYLGKAKGIYTVAKYLKFFKTKRWNFNKNLKGRIQLVNRIKSGRDIPEDYFKSKEYTDIYTCNSCHQNGRKSKILNIKHLESIE